MSPEEWKGIVASLEFDEASDRYRIRFRYGGRPYKRSIKTVNQAEAAGVVARVEETIRLLERGRLEMPADADPGVFIMTDGKQVKKTTSERAHTLEGLLATYQESIPLGAKAETTIITEGLHIAHLLGHLKKAKPMQKVTTSEMQGYVDKRLRDSYRKKLIRPETVRKEVATFRLIWNWAVAHGHVVGAAPTRGLKYPKTEQKPPFMTREEIEKVIKRGGLTVGKEAGLWECLFLTSTEVQDVLEFVKQAAEHPFIYPMFVFVAHTGASLWRSRCG